MEPRLSPAVVAALTVEGIREVAAYELTLGLFKAAEKHGASMRVSTVDGLTWHDGRVSGVRLATGEQLACDKVVLAMGPWTGQVERWLDLPVPVSPLKGQILRLEAPGPPLEHVFYRWGGGYIASKPDGLTWTGTTEEEVGFDDLPTPEARESIMSEACQVMPSLSQAKVALQTACLRPVSKDGLPIIGSVPGREGVYLATGAGRKGILLGPGMAMAIADLVTEGHTPIPIEPFSPDRFVATDQRTG
jgi:glycine oxidase